MRNQSRFRTNYIYLILATGLVACNSGASSSSNSTTNTSNQQQLTAITSKTTTKLASYTAAAKENLNSIAKGNNIYVSVGDNGYIVSSTDGSSWGNASSGLAQNFHAVAFNSYNKLFYAVGDNGTVISSADGKNWQLYKSLSPLRDLYSIITVNGKLVIGAANSTIFEIDTTSPRGLVTVLSTVDNMKLISAASNSSVMILGSDDAASCIKMLPVSELHHHGQELQNLLEIRLTV